MDLTSNEARKADETLSSTNIALKPVADQSGFLLPSAPSESVGIPDGALSRLRTRIVERGLVMHSLLVIRKGRVAFEQYGEPYDSTTPHRLYSVSKSYVAVAIGTLIDDGLLSLEDRAVDVLGDEIVALPRHPWIEDARVRDLLTMTGPHLSTTYKRTADPDWVRTFFTTPPGKSPGTSFAYDTSSTIVLTAIVERLTGRRIAQYLQERVLDPIGCQTPLRSLMSPKGADPLTRSGGSPAREIDHNDAGVSHGGSGFFATPRDLARFALLCMSEGRCHERQIVSAEYIRAATAYQVSTLTAPEMHPDRRQGYGFQFWRTRHNGFAALGMGGQVALCVPDADLIVVATGDNQPEGLGFDGLLDAVWDELLPAIPDLDTPPVTAVHSFAPAAPAGVMPAPTVRETWVLDPGDTDLASVEVVTDGARGTLTMTTVAGATRQIPFGVGAFLEHRLPGYGYPSRSAGAWVDDSTLHVRTHVTGDFLAQLEFTLGINGDAVTVVMRRSAELFADEYSGTASGLRGRSPRSTAKRLGTHRAPAQNHL